MSKKLILIVSLFFFLVIFAFGIVFISSRLNNDEIDVVETIDAIDKSLEQSPEDFEDIDSNELEYDDDPKIKEINQAISEIDNVINEEVSSDFEDFENIEY